MCWSCFTTIRISEDDLRTIRAGLSALTSDYNEGQCSEWRNAMDLLERVDRLIAGGVK